MKLLHRHNEKIDKLEKLTKKFEESPAFQAFEKEEAKKTLERRRLAADRLEVLKQEAEELATGKDELEEKLHKMEAERQKIQTEITEKKVRLMQKKAGIEAGIRREQEALYSSCDSRIDDAIEFFRDQLDRLRSPGRISVNYVGGRRNIFTEKITTHMETNRGAVLDALSFCQNAILTLEAAKMQPAVDTAKIEDLKKDIPAVDIYEEAEGERVLPGSRVPNSLSLLPSDGAMEFKTRRILEKAEKILKR